MSPDCRLLENWILLLKYLWKSGSCEERMNVKRLAGRQMERCLKREMEEETAEDSFLGGGTPYQCDPRVTYTRQGWCWGTEDNRWPTSEQGHPKRLLAHGQYTTEQVQKRRGKIKWVKLSKSEKGSDDQRTKTFTHMTPTSCATG